MSEIESKELLELIDRYWELAYAEGSEGRSHDTEDGEAQRVRSGIERAIAALATQQPQGVPVGFVLVPAVLDSKMLDAGIGAFIGFRSEGEVDAVWAAMLAAAPSPERQ